MEAVEDTIRAFADGFLLADDVNGRGREWEMGETNSRGNQMFEMAARLSLLVLNAANTPTYVRPGYRSSVPDITLVSEKLANRAVD